MKLRDRFADEEPDFDEMPWTHERAVAVADLMADHCARCGVRGHEGKDCPTITPDLLKELR